MSRPTETDVIVLGVPQTYPPTSVKGIMVSSFLTPSKDSMYTYPPLIKWDLERLIRASTQRSRAQSEIAKAYQVFNRPSLARPGTHNTMRSRSASGRCP